MDTIQTYLDNIFKGYEGNAKAQRIKQEMLSHMIEHYQDLKYAGKSENEAIGAVISEFGNADELLAEIGGGGSTAEKESPSLPELSSDYAREYIDTVQRASGWIALGVALILTGVSVMLAAFSVTGEGNAFGVILFFLFLIPSVILLIVNGIKVEPFEHLQPDSFTLPAYLRSRLTEERRPELARYPLIVGLSVGVILFGVLLVAGAGALRGEGTPDLVLPAVSLMMLLIAVSVWCLIRYGMVHDAYDRLLGKKSFTSQHMKANERKVSAVASVWWPVTTVVFLVTGFVFRLWNMNWIIWPISGILFGAVSGLINSSGKDPHSV